VLERTSGPACDRARELLCAAADGTADPLDEELLRSHLEDCQGCSALAVALDRLGRDLPTLAQLDPGPGFVTAVLEATLPPRTCRARFADRFRRAWEGLVARPRIAWEAGYVGSVAVWLLMSLAGVPLPIAADLGAADVPVRAAAVVTDRVSAVGRHVWTSGARSGAEHWSELQSDLARRYGRAAEVTGVLREGGERLTGAVLRLDWSASGRAWEELTNDTKSTWARLVREGDAEPANESQRDSTRDEGASDERNGRTHR
jgi:hypothetical protein